MKRAWTLLLPFLALLLTACGGSETPPPEVDLSDLFTELADECDWEADYLVDTEDELLESWYPGLQDIPIRQLVAKAPLMSAVVNEVVLVQCETEEDAAKAAAILEERIAYQVGDEQNPGGAWYPESIEAWKKAQVIQQGTYVALLASAEHQEDLVERFNEYFEQ